VSKKPSKPVGKAGRSVKKSGPRLYILEVLLISGPVSDEFLRANPKISRTLQVRSDQTFDQLADAIKGAFDLDDDHLYAFYIPQGRSKRDGEELEDLGKPISSLDLQVGSLLRYHFDFGDDWKYNIKVKKVGEPDANEKYPKVIQKVGESPPQYSGDDEEDWNDDDWDEESEEEMPEAAAADVSLLIGEMHLKAGEYIKAVEAFTRSIEANPAASDEYEGRSRAYRALADEDERKAKELRAGLS
jgi:tetratricopeptide (TPR) repeat protein